MMWPPDPSWDAIHGRDPDSQEAAPYSARWPRPDWLEEAIAAKRARLMRRDDGETPAAAS